MPLSEEVSWTWGIPTVVRNKSSTCTWRGWLCYDTLWGALAIINKYYMYVVALFSNTGDFPFALCRRFNDVLQFQEGSKKCPRVHSSIYWGIPLSNGNKEKAVVLYVRGMKYLDRFFDVMKGKFPLTVHPKSTVKMKSRFKSLMIRSQGWEPLSESKSGRNIYVVGCDTIILSIGKVFFLKQVDSKGGECACVCGTLGGSIW